ncbi:MAG: hypothetical protein ACO39F_07440, partial [Candidatus Nanopelagicaceae bacterium]
PASIPSVLAVDSAWRTIRNLFICRGSRNESLVDLRSGVISQGYFSILEGTHRSIKKDLLWPGVSLEE